MVPSYMDDKAKNDDDDDDDTIFYLLPCVLRGPKTNCNVSASKRNKQKKHIHKERQDNLHHLDNNTNSVRGITPLWENMYIYTCINSKEVSL
jgi:hypothetical protein